MSIVGLAALTIGVILVLGVIAATFWPSGSRRERARLLHGTVALGALAAEEKHARARAAEQRASSEEERAAAAQLLREAEQELEEVARQGERARAADPDLESNPDPDLPRLD